MDAVRHKEISQRCASLRLTYELAPTVIAACKTKERQKIVESCAMLIMYFVIIIQRAIAERKISQAHVGEINAETQIGLEKMKAKKDGVLAT